MRIRTKIGIMELILVAGFVLALGVVAFYTTSILQLKDFQLQSQRVLSRLDKVNYRTQTILTTGEEIGRLRKEWTGSILNFEAALKELARSDTISILNEEQQEQMKSAVGWWDQIYSWYYQPAITHLERMESSKIGELVGSNGILQTLLELNAAGESVDFIGDFYTIQNYQELIIDETAVFVNRMDSLSEAIDLQSERYIRNSSITAVSVIFVTIVAAVFLAFIFSRRLANRINAVESSIRRMADGDFSYELHIESGDEFENLSQNYNFLKNQLQEKLNAVLNFMLNINTTLPGGPDLEHTLKLIADSAVENTTADGAAVHLIEEKEDRLVPKSISGSFAPPYPVADGKTDPIPLESSVLGEAVSLARPIFIRDTEKDEHGFLRGTSDPYGIWSLIVTPLTVNNRVLGTITLEKRTPGTFTDLDYTHMQTFTDYAALTIESIFAYRELIEQRELRRDIQIAADIQSDLLPKQIPELKSFKISAFSEAARGISGDYYDAFLVENGKMEVVICDVVGKGVPASLLMVMIRTIIRLVASPKRTPAQLLTFLNRGIKDRIGTDHFATMSILHYDEREKTVVYSNAAHPPLLIYRKSRGEFVEADTPGLPIGVEKDETYRERTLRLESGDILLLFTDGLSEARGPGGHEYGLAPIKDLVAKNADKSPEAIRTQIRKDIERFEGDQEQHDDQTLIIMKIS